MTTWSTHGLIVHSDSVAIDAAVVSDDVVPDVELTLSSPADTVHEHTPPGRVMAQSHNGEFKYLTVVEQQTATGAVVVARFHGLATARLAVDGSEVELIPDPGWDADYAPVLLNGTIMALVLTLRGHPVLHASAVTVADDGGTGALAFVGSSGMGKSTVATLVCRDGGGLVTDDLLRTDLLPGGGVLAWPGARRTRLRPGAAELAAAVGDDVQFTADGRAAPRLTTGPIGPVPLLALAVPVPDREADRPRARRFHGAEAVLALARFPRIVGWTDPQTTENAHRHWGELLRQVPIHEVKVPWGPPFEEGVGRALVAAILQHSS